MIRKIVFLAGAIFTGAIGVLLLPDLIASPPRSSSDWVRGGGPIVGVWIVFIAFVAALRKPEGQRGPRLLLAGSVAAAILIVLALLAAP